MADASIPVDENSKDFEDLRDRAAYVYATGTYPTHLRTTMMNLLSKVARYTKNKTAMDGLGGSIEIAKHNAAMLGLDDHPMVSKVREYVRAGYRIQVSRELKARRPFGKVFMLGAGGERVTVQRDGSVLTSW